MEKQKMQEQEELNYKLMKRVKTVKLVKTLLLIFTWIAMGMVFSVQTSCLPDLLVRLNTTTESFSYALSLGSIGGIMGAVTSGFIDRLFSYTEVIMGVLLLVSGVCTCLKPLIATVALYGVVVFVDSMSWVLVNSAGTVVILSLWGDNAGGSMQAMHMGYPIGALLGGLVAVPFVSSSNCMDDEMDDNTTNCDDGVDPDGKYLDGSTIQFAFAIAAIFTVSVGVAHFVVHFIKVPADKLQKQTNSSMGDLLKPSKWAGGDGRFGVIIVVLLCFFYFFEAASMKAVLVYISAYAVDSGLGFDKAEAAALNGVTNAIGGVGRAVFIPLASNLSVMKITMLAVHGQLLFMLLISTVGTQYKLGLWISCCGYAFFRDPLFPSAFTWGNHYIILLAFIVGITVIISATGDLIQNILLGYLYTNTIYESIFYVSMLCCVIVTGVVYTMHLYVRNREPRSVETLKDGKQNGVVIVNNVHDNVAFDYGSIKDEQTKM